MKIAIYGSRRQGEFITRIIRMLNTLANNGVEIIMHSKLYKYLRSEVPGDLPVSKVIGDEPVDADVAISLGGDGTFLKTARWIGERHIPIVGINTGHLGYLAAFSFDDINYMLELLLSGKYIIEKRTLLMIKSQVFETSHPHFALNEVALMKSQDASMITCSLSINSGEPARYQADGVIISTPTGSTGYNLSVGGPIVEPTAGVMIISPIAAHSLTMRPLVISDSSRIEITTRCRAPHYLVSLDGNSIEMPADTSVTIEKAPFMTLVIQRPDHTFTDTLRTKLMWGL